MVSWVYFRFGGRGAFLAWSFLIDKKNAAGLGLSSRNTTRDVAGFDGSDKTVGSLVRAVRGTLVDASVAFLVF